ncbi:hypothetical protein Vadar_015455 [Vaccinium darrowii]|uniref:Uncharacterized protein n=1 Tax=Vaccinium darrowii TaxID=229202 RepID=A0ACB7XZW0_9ERIC|nr:hypothetical protein Vadar_015455 [Vaccinium darrowii]
MQLYLLKFRLSRGNVAVALADDGGLVAAVDHVNLPVSVVVVDDVNDPRSDPWHSLNQPLSEMVMALCITCFK